MAAALLKALCLATLGAAAPASTLLTPPPAGSPTTTSTPAAIPPERHTDWLVVPLFTYNSDYKFGFGGAAQIQWTGDIQPYRAEVAAQVLFTTSGQQSHWVKVDVPHLLGSAFRLTFRADYHREIFEPYFGAGNDTTDTLNGRPLTSDHDFAYDRKMPLARLGSSYEFLPGFTLFGIATLKSLSVGVYPGSLLALQRPYGIDGGHTLEGSFGVAYDSRDNEAVPTRGTLIELSVRGASQSLGSTYGYFGATARALKFVSLGPRFVLAMRLEDDVLSDGAPFFELSNFGGEDALEGVGGQYSARGIPALRYTGHVKAVGTLEVRARIFDWSFSGQPISFGMVGFLDAGRVWDEEGNDGPWYKIHPGYGGGLRLWRRSFVLRADVGSSPDRPASLYLLFGHFF